MKAELMANEGGLPFATSIRRHAISSPDLRYRRLESGSYSLAMRLPSMKTSSEVP
jgi:hypothetical protein